MAQDFNSLKITLRRWLGVSVQELDEDTAGEIINIAARRYARLHESRYGEWSDTFQSKQFIRDYLVPEGWSKPRSFWYPSAADSTTSVFIDYVNKDTFDATFPASGLYGSGFSGPMGSGSYGEANLGEPVIYTVWAGYIQLGPVPNRVFTIYRNYWRIPPDLTAVLDTVNGQAGPTSQFTIQAWEYLLYKSLVTASEFGFEDKRVPMWQAEVNDMETRVTIEDARSRTTAQRPVSVEPG